MSKSEKLGGEAIKKFLSELPGWRVVKGRLAKSYEFGNFSEAFGFMTRVAIEAEKLNHHPDWSNSWNKVEIEIVNHEVGGLTEIDFDLASSIEGLV